MSDKISERKVRMVEVDPALRQLFSNYLIKRCEELKSVPELIRAGNHKEIEFMGHKISGNAGLFGLDEFAKKGEALEGAARNLNSEQIVEIAARMYDEISLVRLAPELSPSELSANGHYVN